MIPNEFAIPNTDLTLHIQPTDGWNIVESSFLQMDLNLYLQSEQFPFEGENNVEYPPFVLNSTDYHEIEAILSEFIIDDLLHLVHKYGFIDFEIPSTMTEAVTVRLLKS